MSFSFLRRQFTKLPYPTQSFQGQTIIVTGSNVGLGLEAARHFVRCNASKVILAVRSLAKGEDAARSIQESTGREGVCEVWQVDMGNFESVKEFARKAADLDRLDAVLENAGILTTEYSELEGMESTIAVNVVGSFLLALNLLPTLRKSGKKHEIIPRLVITSSDLHLSAKFAERHEDSILSAMNKNDRNYMDERYATSKLLEVFTVRALAAQMSSGPHTNEPVILNTVNPGLCQTSIARDVNGIFGYVMYIMVLLIGRTAEVGSRTLVAGACAGKESHGKYMSECVVAESSEFVESEEGTKTQERFYNELMGLLEKIQPGITKNI